MRARQKSLRDHFGTAWIIAAREDTNALEAALTSEGFDCRVVRGPYPGDADSWSASVRCLWNHLNAWREIQLSGRGALVVEADFVPVRGIGSLPSLIDSRSKRTSLGYIYACGPQLWDLEGGLRGHAGSTVAYCLSPELAANLIEFAESEVLVRDLRAYSGWDSELGFWLNRRGIECYLPYRQYGEHGGLPNPEHRKMGLRATHRADLLAGALHFLPIYARGSRLHYVWIRTRARFWGLVRLAAGRFLAWHDLVRSPSKIELIRVAVGRQFKRRSPLLGHSRGLV